MTQLTKNQKIGIAAQIITSHVWKSARNQDKISVAPEMFSLKSIDLGQLSDIAKMFDRRPTWSRVLNRSGSPDFAKEAKAVLEIVQSHAPNFARLPQLRALEGIKIFDLHFGGDHAEALLLEYVEESVFDEISEQGWFNADKLSA